jgi:glycosyltransferase involved in cell wall biosynthesis
MKPKKALFILHYSPPVHGASKVGDYILQSRIINNGLTTQFIKIKASKNLSEIGRFDLSKVFNSIQLFFKVLKALFFFRPTVIYYTASPEGFAFYRDLLVTFPMKLYQKILSNTEIYYHYHAKGINHFSKESNLKLILSNIFLKKINIILISELLKIEVENINTYKRLYFLSNGVENNLSQTEFKDMVSDRCKKNEIRILFLSNMIKEKGYDTVLDIARKIKEQNLGYRIDFAGGWPSSEDETYFNQYVKKHNLESLVSYHGLVQGEEKKKLFKAATLFIFPSRYKKEVFPLSILEALSYGLPIIAFDVGAVSKIVTHDVGLISNKEAVYDDLKKMALNYQSENTYISCRDAYLKKYTVTVFEKNLLGILLNSSNVQNN